MSKTRLTTRRRVFDRMYARIVAQYPDAYRVPGLGWCGPDWDILTARTDTLADLYWRAELAS